MPYVGEHDFKVILREGHGDESVEGDNKREDLVDFDIHSDRGPE
jgi:hypothetical protein